MSAPVPIEGQVRVIEKKGLLILSAQEKAAHLLNIYFSVLQVPYEHSVNYLYPRDKSLYGRFNLLAEGYTLDTGLIYYQNSKLFSINRQIEASTEGLGCYIDAIFRFFTIVAPLINSNFSWTYSREPIHIYPPQFDAIAFKLPDGCIAQVTTTGYLMQGCELPATELLEPPPPPAFPPPPGNPPPFGSPPNSGAPGSDAPFIISPPYDGDDDNGDTYVPPPPPPDFPDNSDYGGLAYRIDAIITTRKPDGSIFSNLGVYPTEAIIYGKFVRVEEAVLNGYKLARAAFRRTSSSELEYSSFGGSTSDLSISFEVDIQSISRI